MMTLQLPPSSNWSQLESVRRSTLAARELGLALALKKKSKNQDEKRQEQSGSGTKEGRTEQARDFEERPEDCGSESAQRTMHDLFAREVQRDRGSIRGLGESRKDSRGVRSRPSLCGLSALKDFRPQFAAPAKHPCPTRTNHRTSRRSDAASHGRNRGAGNRGVRQAQCARPTHRAP